MTYKANPFRAVSSVRGRKRKRGCTTRVRSRLSIALLVGLALFCQAAMGDDVAEKEELDDEIQFRETEHTDLQDIMLHTLQHMKVSNEIPSKRKGS